MDGMHGGEVFGDHGDCFHRFQVAHYHSSHLYPIQNSHHHHLFNIHQFEHQLGCLQPHHVPAQALHSDHLCLHRAPFLAQLLILLIIIDIMAIFRRSYPVLCLVTINIVISVAISLAIGIPRQRA